MLMQMRRLNINYYCSPVSLCVSITDCCVQVSTTQEVPDQDSE